MGGAFAIGANKLHDGGNLGLNIEGQGITAAIWDGGYSRQTHEEFSERVVYGEEDKANSDHGTHVAGTIISKGISRVTRGMAPRGQLISYRFDNDAVEMLNQASNGILLSNHSYGASVDEDTPVFYYGKYDGSAMEFDRITSLFKYYLPVVSAGNDRGSGLNGFDNNYDY